MSNKVDFQRKLKEIGYEIGPYASKETLSNVLRLHALAVETKEIDVAKLSDLALRKNLTEAGLTVGPVTNHTRSIYQRKFLEILLNEMSEGREDEEDVQESISTTPPSRSTRSSIVRDTSATSSPGRVFPKEFSEPRIPLTRVDVEDKSNQNSSSLSFSSGSQNKSIYSTSLNQEIITHSYSAQRSTSKSESRPNSGPTYGLRNPYDFTNDEPVIIRHEHKATPFRPSNFSSIETTSTNSNRFVPSTSMRTDSNEIRSRLTTNTNEPKEIQIEKDLPTKTSVDTTKKDQIIVPKKSGGTILYTGIAVTVALFVFVIYLWLEN